MTTEAERLADQLTRESPYYEAAALLRSQAAELTRLYDYDARLTAGMPADFKDWHENSNKEWPEIAAWVITSLREREDAAWKHAKWLNTRLYKSETSLRLMEKTCNKLDDTIEVEDTLLRQALKVLTFYVEEDDVVESMAGNEFWVAGKRKAEASITAIKQHLGEV